MKIVFFAPFFVALTSAAKSSRKRVRPHQTSSKAAKSSGSPNPAPSRPLSAKASKSSKSILLEPFEVTGCRLVCQGISELSQSGKTQLEMLLADYVEQFYNDDDEGQGTARQLVTEFQNSISNVTANITEFQNSISNVNANITITNITTVEPPPTDGERRAQTGSVSGDMHAIFTGVRVSEAFLSDFGARRLQLNQSPVQALEAAFVLEVLDKPFRENEVSAAGSLVGFLNTMNQGLFGTLDAVNVIVPDVLDEGY